MTIQRILNFAAGVISERQKSNWASDVRDALRTGELGCIAGTTRTNRDNPARSARPNHLPATIRRPGGVRATRLINKIPMGIRDLNEVQFKTRLTSYRLLSVKLSRRG